MANFSDLIGAFLQNTAAPGGRNRMGNLLKDLQQLAQRSGLEPAVVLEINRTMGVAA